MDDLREKISKLFEFGFLTTSEKERLLKVYSEEGLSLNLSQQIENLLKKDISALEEEITSIDAEIKKLENLNKQRREIIYQTIEEVNKNEIKSIKDNFQKSIKIQDNKFKRFQFETRALSRKIEEKENEAKRKIDHYLETLIRQKFS
jgi:hypothetical protein